MRMVAAGDQLAGAVWSSSAHDECDENIHRDPIRRADIGFLRRRPLPFRGDQLRGVAVLSLSICYPGLNHAGDCVSVPPRKVETPTMKSHADHSTYSIKPEG